MFASLVFGAALTAPAAPVPRDTVPTPTGPAPIIGALREVDDGRVLLTVNVPTKRKLVRKVAEIENGKRVEKQIEEEFTELVSVRKPLGEFEAKFSTVSGSELTAAAAAKRFKDWAPVLVSADGKPIDKGWLLGIDPDTIVITAESLVGASFMYGGAGLPTTAAPRLVLLATDMDGKLKLAYNPTGGANDGQVFVGRGNIAFNQVMAQRANINFDGAPATPNAPAAPTKLLDEVKFDAYDLTGKVVSKEETLKRLKAGGLVLVAGDNRMPDAAYLKPFKGELLVLVSPELIGVPNGVGAPGVRPGGLVRPLPVAPGAIIGPAIAAPAPAILPAKPIVAPVKPVAPAKPAEEKPAEKVKE